MKTGQDKDIVLIDLLPISRIDKRQRQNAEVEKILPMNPGEALGNNRFETEVSRRDGGMLATWAADGHRFGLPDNVRRLITEGKIIVVAAPVELAPELQGLFPDLRVLRFTGQLDAARAPLTPRACLRRIVGPRIATRLESRVSMPRTDAISHAGDLPSAVRSLSEGLLRIELRPAGALAIVEVFADALGAELCVAGHVGKPTRVDRRQVEPELQEIGLVEIEAP